MMAGILEPLTGRDILGYDDDEDEESEDEEFEDGPSFEELQMKRQTRETLENAESRARANGKSENYHSKLCFSSREVYPLVTQASYAVVGKGCHGAIRRRCVAVGCRETRTIDGRLC